MVANLWTGHQFLLAVIIVELMRAIVTAGANGLGRAIAICLAKQNFKVLCVDIDKNGLNELENLSKKELNGNIRTIIGDVGDPAMAEKCVNKAIDLFGGIDVLVNNAGINNTIPIQLHEFDFEWWQRVMAVNLNSTFLFSKYCIKQFLKQMESSNLNEENNNNYNIVNISSVHAVASQRGVPAYAASKGAILSLTKQMAIEYANENIRVNCILPGLVATPRTIEILTSNGRTVEDAAKLYPMKRAGKPIDIAEMVSFLISDKANFITGQCICVDGGVTVKAGWADHNALDACQKSTRIGNAKL